MSSSRRFTRIFPALALIALAVPSSAAGQASRTWVSGVGDDVNPCSRTAPCKTFAGAISKTAAGGEINTLDSGGFGGVTITKSITIKAQGVIGGVLVSGANAIVINAAATDRVTLQGLDINGLGTGLCGVRVLAAKAVLVRKSEIYQFKTGVCVVPTVAAARVLVARNDIHDNDIGVFNGPGSAAGTDPRLTLRHNDFSDNVCAASVGAFGPNNTPPDASSACGAAGSGSGLNAIATISAFNNGFNDNGTAVFARGTQGAFEIGANDITGNSVGLARLDNGFIKSFGNNIVTNNGSTASPNTTATFTRRSTSRGSR